MKSKRGITLIELIAVLALIAVVAVIAAPVIFDQVTKGREQMYTNQVSIIIDAARSWATNHVEDLPNTLGGEVRVTIEQLQINGYLDMDFKNVKTNNPFPLESYVLIRCIVSTSTNYDYTYTFIS